MRKAKKTKSQTETPKKDSSIEILNTDRAGRLDWLWDDNGYVRRLLSEENLTASANIKQMRRLWDEMLEEVYVRKRRMFPPERDLTPDNAVYLTFDNPIVTEDHTIHDITIRRVSYKSGREKYYMTAGDWDHAVDPAYIGSDIAFAVLNILPEIIKGLLEDEERYLEERQDIHENIKASMKMLLD